jgi:hypothetical protein
MMEPTPNLNLARPADDDDDWGEDYRAAMGSLDGHSHGEDGRATSTATSPSGNLLLDYGVRTDDQPLYLGRAAPGSLTTDAVWRVLRFTYESDEDYARMLAVIVRENVVWTDRAIGW